MSTASGPPAASADPDPTLRAVTVSAAVSDISGGRDRGEVLSVHRRALNLRFDDRLVAIVSGAAEHGAASAARGPCPPFGIVVRERLPIAGPGLRPGLAAVVDAGRIRIGGRLTIDLRRARTWSPWLEQAPTRWEWGRLAERAALARTLVGAHGPHGLAPGSMWHSSAHEPLGHLPRALAAGDIAAGAAAGIRLVGLGAGLTPSGDDVLVGMTAALTAVGDGAGADLAAAWAAVADARTTPIAAAFHRHAATGAYDAIVHEVLAAVLRGTTPAARGAVARTAGWGATSGRDLLAGIVLGLEAAAARACAPARPLAPRSHAAA